MIQFNNLGRPQEGFTNTIMTLPQLKVAKKRLADVFRDYVMPRVSIDVQHHTWRVSGIILLLALTILGVWRHKRNQDVREEKNKSHVNTNPKRSVQCKASSVSELPQSSSCQQESESSSSSEPLIAEFENLLNKLVSDQSLIIQQSHKTCTSESDILQRDKELQENLTSMLAQTHKLLFEMIQEGLRIQDLRNETRNSDIGYMPDDLVSLIQNAKRLACSISESVQNEIGESTSEIIPSGVINVESNDDSRTLNICYIAAVLQLLRVGYKDRIEGLKDNESLARILAECIEILAKGEESISKDKILDLANYLYDQEITNYEPRKQGCAIELVQNILSRLDTSLFHAQKGLVRPDRSEDRYSNPEIINTLQFPIKENGKIAKTLNEAMGYWSKNSLMDINGKEEGISIHKLDQLPDVFVVSLQRFEAKSQSQVSLCDSSLANIDDDVLWAVQASLMDLQRETHVKIKAAIEIPDIWVIPSNFRASGVEDKPPPIYQLYAFINHLGEERGTGHYIAHTYENGFWVQCNDNNIMRIETSEADEERKKARDNGVIFLYKRLTL